MKHLHKFNAGTVLALAIFCYISYTLLVTDTFLHISISSIIAYAHNLATQKHLLILGLLPIYIAIVIFGTVMLGLYCGSLLQNVLLKAIHIKNK